MSNKNILSKIQLQRDIDKNAADLSQKILHDFVKDRVINLHSVGVSVTSKLLGPDLLKIQLKSFPLNLRWLLFSSFSIGEITEGYIQIIPHDKNKVPFQIRKNLLYISDREFASIVRHEIKDSRIRAEILNIRNSQIIADLEAAILLKKAEIKFHKKQQF